MGSVAHSVPVYRKSKGHITVINRIGYRHTIPGCPNCMHNSHAHILPTPHYTHIHIHTHTLTTNYRIFSARHDGRTIIASPSDQHAANSWDSAFRAKCQRFQRCEYTHTIISCCKRTCDRVCTYVYLQPIGRMVGTYGSEGTSLLDRSTSPGVDPATQQS